MKFTFGQLKAIAETADAKVVSLKSDIEYAKKAIEEKELDGVNQALDEKAAELGIEKEDLSPEIRSEVIKAALEVVKDNWSYRYSNLDDYTREYELWKSICDLINGGIY